MPDVARSREEERSARSNGFGAPVGTAHPAAPVRGYRLDLDGRPSGVGLGDSGLCPMV